jgi:hypothetical protein
MSKTPSLTPFVRRMLAADPPVVRLRLQHVLSRGLRHLEDVPVPKVRPESLTAEDLAREVLEIARAHAESVGGRQVFQVDAHAEGDEAAHASTTVSITAPTDATLGETTSEPTDTRSFGTMAARHANEMTRYLLQSNGAMAQSMGALLDRMDKQLERSDEKLNKLTDRLFGLVDLRLQVADERAAVREQLASAAEDAATREQLMQIVGNVLPAVLPLAVQWLQQRTLPTPSPTQPTTPAAPATEPKS